VVELSEKGRVLGIAADVTDENAVKRFIAAVIEQFGRIDILVNNAGTHLRGTVETTTLDILDRQLRDKVFGFFTMIKAVLPTMKAQRDGRIINIVGQAARHPHPDRFPSGVTNAALMAMSKSAEMLSRVTISASMLCATISSLTCWPLDSEEMRERGCRPQPPPPASRAQIPWAAPAGPTKLPTW
jgi:NAD(P)-dependent dehydrogenase (short-subunit alcohol dehydrogenase family)